MMGEIGQEDSIDLSDSEGYEEIEGQPRSSSEESEGADPEELQPLLTAVISPRTNHAPPLRGVLKVVVDGPIGAGKTSVLRVLQALQEVSMVRPEFQNKMHVIFEDVDEWAYLLKKNYETMDCFHKGGYSWSINPQLFQLKVLTHYLSVTEKLMKLEEACAKDPERFEVVLIERSPLDVLKIFLEVNGKAGVYSKHDLETLLRVGELIASAPEWNNNVHYLILDADAALCTSRMRVRDRDGEENINLTYMTQIEKAYRRFKKDLGERATYVPVSSGQNPYEVANDVLKIIYTLAHQKSD
jgi:deoxyadenosine/deoxycytidine kinase